jgi:hypothetical protein
MVWKFSKLLTQNRLYVNIETCGYHYESVKHLAVIITQNWIYIDIEQILYI